MAKKITHVHKYRLKPHGNNGYKAYFCVQPLCSHYLPMNQIEGKMSICFRCGNPFLITKELIGKSGSEIVKLHCKSCTKSPKRGMEKTLEELFGDL